MTDFNETFERAKKLETLDRMVAFQARKRNLAFNRGVNSYRQIAAGFDRLKNHTAAALFSAAAKREQQLDNHSANDKLTDALAQALATA